MLGVSNAEDVLLVVCVVVSLAEVVPDLETIEVPDILAEFVEVRDTVLLDVDRDVSEGEDVAETLEEVESLKLPELLALPDGEIERLELQLS